MWIYSKFYFFFVLKIDETFDQNEFLLDSKQLLKLLNKCKFSISNDETRHYLSGIYLHQSEVEDKNFLRAVATDSHRMSISKIRLNKEIGVILEFIAHNKLRELTVLFMFFLSI